MYRTRCQVEPFFNHERNVFPRPMLSSFEALSVVRTFGKVSSNRTRGLSSYDVSEYLVIRLRLWPIGSFGIGI